MASPSRERTNSSIEPRLADARLADDGHEPRPRLGDGFRERVAEELRARRPGRPSGASRRRGRSAALAHRDEPVRGHRLRLALELERLDRLDVDGVADQPVRQVAEEHLLLAGGLLEPRGDVDRVAGHEALARRRVAGDDLAGVHAGAVREPDAPARARARRSARSSACCIPAAARTARRASSSCSRGRPKTAMTASPMNFSTMPPWRSSSARIASK